MALRIMGVVFTDVRVDGYETEKAVTTEIAYGDGRACISFDCEEAGGVVVYIDAETVSEMHRHFQAAASGGGHAR